MYVCRQVCGLYVFTSRDDFDELGGNACLTRSVVLQSELFDHFACVFGGVFHCIHARGLLGCRVFEHAVEDLHGQCVFEKVLQRLGVIFRLDLKGVKKR